MKTLFVRLLLPLLCLLAMDASGQGAPYVLQKTINVSTPGPYTPNMDVVYDLFLQVTSGSFTDLTITDAMPPETDFVFSVVNGVFFNGSSASTTFTLKPGVSLSAANASSGVYVGSVRTKIKPNVCGGATITNVADLTGVFNGLGVSAQSNPATLMVVNNVSQVLEITPLPMGSGVVSRSFFCGEDTLVYHVKAGMGSQTQVAAGFVSLALPTGGLYALQGSSGTGVTGVQVFRDGADITSTCTLSGNQLEMPTIATTNAWINQFYVVLNGYQVPFNGVVPVISGVLSQPSLCDAGVVFSQSGSSAAVACIDTPMIDDRWTQFNRVGFFCHDTTVVDGTTVSFGSEIGEYLSWHTERIEYDFRDENGIGGNPDRVVPTYISGVLQMSAGSCIPTVSVELTTSTAGVLSLPVTFLPPPNQNQYYVNIDFAALGFTPDNTQFVQGITVVRSGCAQTWSYHASSINLKDLNNSPMYGSARNHTQVCANVSRWHNFSATNSIVSTDSLCATIPIQCPVPPVSFLCGTSSANSDVQPPQIGSVVTYDMLPAYAVQSGEDTYFGLNFTVTGSAQNIAQFTNTVPITAIDFDPTVPGAISFYTITPGGGNYTIASVSSLFSLQSYDPATGLMTFEVAGGAVPVGSYSIHYRGFVRPQAAVNTFFYQNLSLGNCYNVPFYIAPSPRLDIQKLVRGDFDTTFGSSANSNPGGSIAYQVVVTNTGNIPFDSIDITDVMPYVGDQMYVNCAPRGSQFEVELSGPPTVSAGVVNLSYSDAQTPQLQPSGIYDIGITCPWTTDPAWYSTLGASTNTFRASIGNITLLPTQSVTLSFSGQVPAGTLAGQQACNSALATARRTDNLWMLVTESDSACVSVGPPCNLSAWVSGLSASCAEPINGSINVTINGGGTPPFTLSWAGPTSGSLTTSNGFTNIPNLPIGSYTVSIDDANGCNINQPADILPVDATTCPCAGFSFAADAMTPTCETPQGSINLTITGGSAPYVINWVDVSTGSPGSIIANSMTASFPTLGSTGYNITITDAGGCEATNGVDVGGAGVCPEICGDGIDNDYDGQIDEDCTPPCTVSFIPRVHADVIDAATQYFTLTPNSANKRGAIWSQGMYDFEHDLTLQAELYFGAANNGGEGLAFVIQGSSNTPALSSNLGTPSGIPMFGVEFDTYDNGASDPSDDHVAVFGNLLNNTVSGGAPVSLPANLEDGTWHNVQIEWFAASHNFKVSIDGNVTHSLTNDFITNYFNGNHGLYFGFTGATAGSPRKNLQEIRNISLSGTFTEVCHDGVDNDCDDLVDCLDPDCTADLAVTLTGLLPVYCHESAIEIVANVPDTDATVTWTGPNGFQHIGNILAIPYGSAAVNGLYTVSAGNFDECECLVMDTFSINVSTPMVPSVIVTPENCNDNAATANITVTGGTAPYTLYPDGIVFSNTTTLTNLVAENPSYNYDVMDANGCFAPIVFEVTDYCPCPAINIIAPCEALTACEGQTLVITPQIFPANLPGLTYLWSLNGTPVSAQPELTLTAATSGTYKLVVSFNNGLCTAEAAYAVVAAPAPTVAIASTGNHIFAGCPLMLQATGADFYLWSGPNNYAANLPTINFGATTTQQNGTFTLTGYNSFGCSDTAQVQVRVAQLTASVNNATVPTGSTSVTVSATNLVQTTYLWSGPNNWTANTRTKKRVGLGSELAGTYTVTATAPNGCTATATVGVSTLQPLVQPDNGTATSPEAIKFDVSPNPATTETWFSIQLDREAAATLDLLDEKGSLIGRRELGRITGITDAWPLTDLPTGTYHLVLRHGENTLTRPLIKL